MQLILPDKLTEEAYLSYCEANPNLRLERTARGEIVIVPPAGGESDYRSLEIAAELRTWAKRDGRGVAFGSSVEFLLPDGAALSPDAAWVSNEFVAEILSPSDRLPAAQSKTLEWMENGVTLGWLIDGDARTLSRRAARGNLPTHEHPRRRWCPARLHNQPRGSLGGSLT